MDLWEVFQKRHTTRDFLDKKVDDNIINRIMHSVLKAPSHNHQRPEQFIIL